MVEIHKQIDELTVEQWNFGLINDTLYLNSYFLLKKESKRHKNFKFLKKYDRLMHRDNTIQESEVPFTEELKTEALNQFMSKIKVLKWSEKK